MRKFKPSIFLIIGTVIQLFITSSLSKQTDVQPISIEGDCDYTYFWNRYTCNLLNVVVRSPNDEKVIIGNHLPNHTDSDVRVVRAIWHRNVIISHFNGEFLDKFTNLEYLEMSGIQLSQISENAFNVCGKLDHVRIDGNPLLRTLPSRMLQNCVNLKHLDLNFNDLTSIPEDLFGATTNLEIFEFRSNWLSSLPVNFLGNMRNLKQFLIPSNLIVNIDGNLLANTSVLERVDLSSNPITDTSVITNLLNGHLSLNSIRIENQLTSFDLTFFSQFTELDLLYIGGVPLTVINWNGLPISVTNIHFENVSESIPHDAFSHLTNLRLLSFTGTEITDLYEDTFKQLVNLTSLNIHRTGIRTIPSNIFVNQSNLTQVGLVFNYIEELPEGLFAPLVNLGLNQMSLGFDLFLSGNRIRRLNANSFGYHPYLTNLLLDSNEINAIERDIFARFPNIMERVDLRSNNCSHEMFFPAFDLRNSRRLEYCFNNWDGITSTVAPDAAFKNGVGYSLFSITFILIICLS